MNLDKNYFSGLKVLDHGRYLLGGYVTQVLADLGAEVIKVESMGSGDYCRHELPMRNGVSHYYSALNRSKKSIAVDMKSPEGRKAYLRLVESADVVLDTFRPGVMKRLGIDYENEKKVNPKIIHCSISGFGQNDPRSSRALHDINLQAASGFLSLNGGRTTPIHIVDLSASMVAIQSILAALLQREHTGEGAYCDIKMFDSFVWWNSLIDARYDFYGNEMCPEKLDYPALAYDIYDTSDGGKVAIGMLEDKFWSRFLKGVGREDLFPYKLCHKEEAPEAHAELEKVFKTKTRMEWKEFFDGIDTCAMICYTKDEAIQEILASGSGLMGYCDFPRTGKTLQTRLPHDISTLPVSLDTAFQSPSLGEHSALVLKEVGYTQAEIDALLEKGVIEIS